MKSERIAVTITEEMVESYEGLFGKQDFLPPSFPMLFYQWIEVPWKYDGIPIHRKQKCSCYQPLVVGETYYCEAVLDEQVERGNVTFYTQFLIGYDLEGKERFRCVSELIVRFT